MIGRGGCLGDRRMRFVFRGLIVLSRFRFTGSSAWRGARNVELPIFGCLFFYARSRNCLSNAKIIRFLIGNLDELRNLVHSWPGKWISPWPDYRPCGGG